MAKRLSPFCSCSPPYGKRGFAAPRAASTEDRSAPLLTRGGTSPRRLTRLRDAGCCREAPAPAVGVGGIKGAAPLVGGLGTAAAGARPGSATAVVGVKGLGAVAAAVWGGLGKADSPEVPTWGLLSAVPVLWEGRCLGAVLGWAPVLAWGAAPLRSWPSMQNMCPKCCCAQLRSACQHQGWERAGPQCAVTQIEKASRAEEGGTSVCSDSN